MKIIPIIVVLFLAPKVQADNLKIEAMFGIGMGQKIDRSLNPECGSIPAVANICMVPPIYKPKIFESFSVTTTKKNNLVHKKNLKGCFRS